MRSQQEKPMEAEGQLPRREIQGLRPAPLKICRASHGIRKPVVPIAGNRVQPVIIYTHSPKIIHTEAQHFMTLVQRLTGSSGTRSRTKKPKHCPAADHQRPATPSASLEPAESTEIRCSVEENAVPSHPSSSCNYNRADCLLDRTGEDDLVWPPASDVSMNCVQPANHGSLSPVSAADNSFPAVNRSSQYGCTSSATTSAVSAVSGGLFPPLSPNSLMPSPNYGLVSPSIFQDLPLLTPNSDNFFYSPRHFYRFSEPIFTPPQRPSHSSLISPSPSALDLYKSLPEYQ